MLTASRPQPVVFPVRGLHEGVGYDIQPPGTSPDLLNVRGYDALKNRLRGGRRPGLSKYLTDQVNGANPIQALQKVVEAVNSASTSSTITDDFSSGVYTTVGKGNVGDDYVRGSIQGNAGGTMNVISTVFDGVNDVINFDRVRYSDGSFWPSPNLFCIAYLTTNDITTVTHGSGVATTNQGGDGDIDECTLIGPIIRASNTLSSGIGARLIRVGANQVQLQVFSYVNKIYTSLAVSATQNLNGAGAATADVTIRLQELGTTVQATLNWPTQAIVNLVVSVSSATNLGNSRAGVMTSQTSNGANIVSWRKLTSITYTKIVPRSRTTLYELDGSVANPVDSNRFYLPTGWTSTTVDVSAHTVTKTAGFASAVADPAYIAIDDTLNLVWDAAGDVANSLRFVEPSVGVQSDLELSLQDGLTAANGDGFGAGFLVSADGTSGIFVYIPFFGSVDRANTGCAGVDNSQAAFITIVSGSTNLGNTTMANFGNGTVDSPIGRTTGYWRLAYDSSLFKITMYHNEIPVFSYTLTAGQQAQIATFTGTRTVAILQNLTSYDAKDGIEKVRWSQTDPFLSGTALSLLTVSGGTVYAVSNSNKLIPSGGSNAVSTDAHAIQIQQAYGKAYIVDGSVAKVYSRSLNTVSAWVPSSGALPSGARLISLYRGRLVLAGVASDPHNWFMSKVGDPQNFDYSPAQPNFLQAVAGNNSSAGLIGDLITALVPFSDDKLLFGGDQSLWMMTGDPAAGGSVDQISDQTGIAFGRAWAKDPHGILYFMGTDGVYRFNPNSEKPENIALGRLDNRLQRIDLNTNRVYMAWDFLRKGLMVQVVSATTTAANVSYFWDSRADAWYPDSYPASMGPNVMYALDGPQADDQTFLFGSRDGYIRQVDDAANDDDGIAITSRVRFAPFLAPTRAQEVILNSVSPVLAAGSGGTMYLNVYTGQTGEECSTATTPRVRRLIKHAGRNGQLRHKVRGAAIQLELSHTGSARWALENLTVGFEQGGMPRKEAKSAGA